MGYALSAVANGTACAVLISMHTGKCNALLSSVACCVPLQLHVDSLASLSAMLVLYVGKTVSFAQDVDLYPLS